MFNEFLGEEASSKDAKPAKELNDNIIHILNLIIHEFPHLLVIEYLEDVEEAARDPVESNKKLLQSVVDSNVIELPESFKYRMLQDFIRKTKERMTRIQSHSESLVRLDYEDNANKDRLKELAEAMVKSATYIDEALLSLRVRIDLCAPLLRHLSDSIQMFQAPVNDLLNDLQNFKYLSAPFHDVWLQSSQEASGAKSSQERVSFENSELARSKKVIDDFLNA